MKNNINNTKKQYFIAFILVMIVAQVAIAQPPPPGPATGAPIDGLSGILMMIGAALFGKKFFNKK